MTPTASNRIIRYTPVFTANKQAYHRRRRYISNQGSSRSSKTYSIMQLLTLIGQKEPGLISVCSPSLPHLKRGAMRDFMDITGDGMNGQNIYRESQHNKTDNIYEFNKKSRMEFFGVENAAKVRGPGRRILYINEANLISFEAFTQLALRTTDTIFMDYNPADMHSWVYDIVNRPNSEFIHSTYKNNRGNLPQYQIDEIEYLQHADQNLWRVFGLGLKGTSAETIYTHWLICKNLPEQYDSESFGLDFGFNHPACLVRTIVSDNKVYAKELLYESGLDNTQLAQRIKLLLGDREKPPIIWCDSARPEAIAELRKFGLDAREADKAVYEGILSVKARPLYFTQDSTNLIKEAKSYKWMKHKTLGITLDEPVKFMDDAMDALRYSIYSVYKFVKRKSAAA